QLGESGSETVGSDRLEQVVKRVYLEGMNGVLVVSGGEYDLWHVVEPLQQFEPGHAGHLYVKEDHVRYKLADKLKRLLAVACLAGNLYFRMDSQEARQLGARQALVVYHQGSHWHVGIRT